MKKILFLFLSFFFVNLSVQKILIKTDKGDILIKLFPKKALITVANFLKYVDEKQYDGKSFYRSVRLDNQSNKNFPIQIIQGGLYQDTLRIHAPIPIETRQKTKLSHRVGAVSMARTSPNSATSEFFIVLNENQPQLDFKGKRNPDGYGFAVFGKVIKGMKTLKNIHQSETIVGIQ